MMIICKDVPKAKHKTDGCIIQYDFTRAVPVDSAKLVTLIDSATLVKCGNVDRGSNVAGSVPLQASTDPIP